MLTLIRRRRTARAAARRAAALAPIRAGIAARRLPADIAPNTGRLVIRYAR